MSSLSLLNTTRKGCRSKQHTVSAVIGMVWYELVLVSHMESPVPTSPSSLATSSTPLSFKAPTPSPAPTLPVSTPSPAPLQYPEPPDEFVQDNITYLNREKTTKKAARLGSS
ncbi:Uncharacterized protein HZ326_29857, partial [Fusarium oxysporum f. sp. albedinis]